MSVSKEIEQIPQPLFDFINGLIDKSTLIKKIPELIPFLPSPAPLPTHAQDINATSTDRASNPGSLITLLAGISQQIFEINYNRIAASVVNSGGNDVTISLDNLTAQNGVGIYLVSGGGAFTFGKQTDFPYTGRLFANSTLGTTLTLTEL
jgi:hypothetical protein